MRTKKFLSIVLTLIMVLGVFGVAAAAAEDANTEEIVAVADTQAAPAAEEAPAAEDAAPAEEEEAPKATPEEIQLALAALGSPIIPQAAMVGWSSAGMNNPENRPDLAGSKDRAVITWDGFIESASGKGDGYATQKSNGLTTRSWRVFEGILNENPDSPNYGKVEKNAGKEYPVRASATAATNDNPQIYMSVSGGQEQLYIKQGTVQVYGRFYIELTISAQATPITQGNSPVSNTGYVVVELVDLRELDKVLTAAKKVLDQKSRYKKVYIDDLQKYYNNALIDKAVGDQVSVNQATAILNAVVNTATGNYALLDTDLPVLRKIDEWFARPFWVTYDVMEEIVRVINLVIGFFQSFFKLIEPFTALATSMFKLVSPIMSILSVLLKLLGLGF